MFEPDLGSTSEGCGYSWEHTPRVLDVRDGYRSLECTECGAEWEEEVSR